MVVSHGPRLYFTKSVYANRKPTLPYTRSLIPPADVLEAHVDTDAPSQIYIIRVEDMAPG